MQRLARNASVWALSALFGCISLFGPGWHCFVGRQFHASSSRHERYCDHGRGSHDAHGLAPQTGPAVMAVDDDCPLCRFFAQAQWTFEFDSAELELPAAGSTAVVERSFWVERIGSYHSRAPPTSSPIC